MDGLMILKVLVTEFTVVDAPIIVLGIYNCAFIYRLARAEANKLHRHFARTDRVSSLPKDSARNIAAVTGEEVLMSSSELLECREKMNRQYSKFTTLTTMFPLFGMLGTVMALIPMVDTIGAEETQLFFGALTSTFWGIVWALFCKGLDISLGYKIEDNEKHIEFLLNPKRSGDEKGE